MRPVLLLALLGLAACTGRARRVETRPADQLLTQGRAHFRSGQFKQAQDLFRRVAFEVPAGDPAVAEANYFAAECTFQLGDRVEAAHQFRRVADEFPASEWASFALLRAGDANAELWRKPVLDPTSGETAIAIYRELIGRYPGTPAAARAQVRLTRLVEQFAEKHYLNGMFYLRRKFYDSAILYFKELVTTYPQSRRVPDALLKLVAIYRAIEYAEEVRETCEHLWRFYPRTPGLERACPAGAAGSR